MEKIKQKLTLSNIITIYIIIQPIIDLITSLCIRHISAKLTIGMFLRAAFMLYIMTYTFLNLEGRSRKMLVIYLASILCYAIIFMINHFAKFGAEMAFAQIKGLIKVAYFPILLLCMILLLKRDKIHVKEKYVFVSLLLYILPIVWCKYFSLGYYTYKTNNNAGTFGLFYAGNEISSILSILVPMYFAKLVTKGITALDYIFTIVIVLAMLEIGTKVGGISIYIIEVIALIIYFIKFIKDRKSYKQLLKMISIFIISIIMLGNTSIGKNYQIKPFVFNETIFKDTKITQTTNKTTQTTTTKTTSTQTAQTKTYADTVIQKPEILLSGRNTYLKNNVQAFKQASVVDKIFGIGYYAKNNDSLKEIKLVEIDYFDILICHGILGTIIIIAPFAVLAFFAIKRFFKNLKNSMKNSRLILSICSILMALGVAMIAGHVFTAPAVSTTLLIAIFIVCKELDLKKDLKDG